MSSRIEDYALIGDLHTAALVGRDGSIDWLCLPRFDSGACFAALLGTPDNGRWLIAPRGEAKAVRRRYTDGTLVLETEFETAEGTAAVIDCMPVRTHTPHLLRVVEGRRGRTAMHTELVIRFDYGSAVPWVQRLDGGLSAIAGPDRLVFRTTAPLTNKHFKTTSEFTVDAGPARGVLAELAPLAPAAAAGRRLRQGRGGDGALVARVVGPLQVPGAVA